MNKDDFIKVFCEWSEKKYLEIAKREIALRIRLLTEDFKGVKWKKN